MTSPATAASAPGQAPGQAPDAVLAGPWTERWPTTGLRPDPQPATADDDAEQEQGRARLVWQVATAGTPVLRNLANLLADTTAHVGGPPQIEVVAHGEGLGLVREGVIAPAVLAELRATGVVLVACAVSMRRFGWDRRHLAARTQVVPSGVGHLLRRQQQGWAYLRA